MNTADTDIFLLRTLNGNGSVAPVSRIGAGQVRAVDAYNARLMAWDSTDTEDPLARTGSLSFRYQPVVDTYTATRTLTVKNLHSSSQNITISADFRYADDIGMGVTIEPLVTEASLPAGQSIAVPIRLTIDAGGMRDWGLNKGSLGANGALFTIFEYDGYIAIRSDSNETITVPWHVLPKKVADVSVTANDATSVTLTNAAPHATSRTEAFSLIDMNSNLYDYAVGICSDLGLPPGCNQTAVDIKEVGIRDWSADLSGDGKPEHYIEFAVTIWDKAYRASQFPVEFDIYVDSNRDGTSDYIVFNYDFALDGSDGRNSVFVHDIKTKTSTPVFFTDSDFNTQNWILTVPSAALELAPGSKFDFYVVAFDGYFTGEAWDCSPFADGDCGSDFHTYTLGVPRFDVGEGNLSLLIPPLSSVTLPFTPAPSLPPASPSQTGLLFLHREAPLGRESSTLSLAAPAKEGTTIYLPILVP
jgi:minor extracellular serine protease Vpr